MAGIFTELSTEKPECFHERIFNAKLRAADLRQSSSPVNKQFYHLPPENFSEAYGIFNRDMVKTTHLIDTPFQNETVVVWIPKKGYSYNSDLTEKDLRLDFNLSARLLERRVRLSRNRLFFEYRGRKWIVLRCEARDFDHPSGKKGEAIL